MTREGLEASVLKVSEPAEVLSYVPHAIGYAPSQSLVAISLRAPRRRIGLVARVDLADVVGEYSSDVVDDLATFLASDGAVASLLWSTPMNHWRKRETRVPLRIGRSRRSCARRTYRRASRPGLWLRMVMPRGGVRIRGAAHHRAGTYETSRTRGSRPG